MPTTLTRRLILEAALALFNRRGSVAVTTHDIAKACGLSPGNLYYHYPNKEAIVRALFEDALERHRRHEGTVARRSGAVSAAGDEAFLKAFTWRYRFFKRELPTLLQRDPALRKTFLAFQAAHLDRLDRAVRQAGRDGRLRTLAAADRRKLVETVWIIALFWPSYVEVSGAPLSRANVDRGADILAWLLGLFAKTEAR